MDGAPLPFGAYLLVERLPGARSTFRAVRRDGGRDDGGGGREVALKRLGTTRGPTGAAPLPGLFHPNLAAPLCSGVVDREPYLASELVAGRSLEELLRSGPLPLAAAARIVAEAARGLAFLHSVRVEGSLLVHRRLSPRTVMVTPAGRVVVCGLDEALMPVRGVLAPDGERSARAPEQLAGEPVDPRTDVHALGVLLNRCLGHRIGVAAVADPRGAELLPPSLRVLAAECLAAARSERPATARAVEEPLRALLSALPEPFGPGELAALTTSRPSRTEPIDTVDDGEPARWVVGPAHRATFLSRIRQADADSDRPAPAAAAGADDGPLTSVNSAADTDGPEGGRPTREAAALAARRRTTRPARPRPDSRGRGRVLLLAAASVGALLVLAVAGLVADSRSGPRSGSAALAEARSESRGATEASSRATGERVAEGIDRWLRRTLPGETASAGALRLRVTRARCLADQLDVWLQVENQSGLSIARPLADLRVGGAALPSGARLTVEPMLEEIAAGAAASLHLAAQLLPSSARGFPTLELAGASLATCPEPSP